MANDAELQRAACSALLTKTAVEIIARQAREIHERDATIRALQESLRIKRDEIADLRKRLGERDEGAADMEAFALGLGRWSGPT